MGEPMRDPEELVIGACLLSPEGIRFAAETLEPADFKSPIHEQIFKAMVLLRKAGEPVEPYSVWKKAQEVGAKGVTSPYLFSIVESVGSGGSIAYYAEQVKEAATRRKLTLIAQQLMQSVNDETVQPSDAAQKAAEAMKNLQAGTRQRITTKTLAEILAVEEDHDWIIPGLLERGDRVLITGFEGGGKTTWIRQLSICMAAGIHPTALDHLREPVRVLVVDAENTEAQWRSQVRGMVRKAASYGLVDPAPLVNVFAGQRIDITKDSTLGEIHRLIDRHNPEVLAIGPIYKMVSTGINNDQEAAPLIMALDSLRDRGVALVMEAHAAKGNSQNAHRDLAPRGSAALMGWPEFGFGLHPDSTNEHQVLVTRWRGDRDQNRDWPKTLERGGPFPWTADLVSPMRRRELYGWDAA
jgi:replicative DNA helicase